MLFWPYPSCKSILHSLLLSVLMTADKGRNAVEPLADPLMQSLAHLNVNVVNLIILAFLDVSNGKKFVSFPVVNRCFQNVCETWSDKVSDSWTRYPIIGLQQNSMKTTICTSMGLFKCILLYH